MRLFFMFFTLMKTEAIELLVRKLYQPIRQLVALEAPLTLSPLS